VIGELTQGGTRFHFLPMISQDFPKTAHKRIRKREKKGEIPHSMITSD